MTLPLRRYQRLQAVLWPWVEGRTVVAAEKWVCELHLVKCMPSHHIFEVHQLVTDTVLSCWLCSQTPSPLLHAPNDHLVQMSPSTTMEGSPSSSTPCLYARRARHPVKWHASCPSQLRKHLYNTRAFAVFCYVEGISCYFDHDSPCTPPCHYTSHYPHVLPSSHPAVIQTDSNTQIVVIPVLRPSFDRAQLC